MRVAPMTSRDDILISLKPQHADHIFGGEKSVELRKRLPKIASGTRIWIYATLPVAAIRGYALLTQIESRSPRTIWRDWGDQTGISKKEFDAYFEDCRIAHALVLKNIMVMSRALPLARIREMVRGFHPPQFYFYLNGAGDEMRLPQRKYRPVKSDR